MKRLVMAGLMSLFAMTAASGEETVTQPDPFESYLDGLVSAQFNDYKLAGMTFVLVQDGKVALSKGFGVADLQKNEAVDPARHLFRPGSVSKLFTWTAVMQLVERGQLDLEADVGEYVDQFVIPNEFDQPLTLTHILTHTPGLEDGALGYLFADEPEDLVPLADSLAAHIPTQVRPPGTAASYSNWATALAGLIVANVSGKSFEEYVRTEIFEPLGMQQATFDEPLVDPLAADMATGYIDEQGALVPLGFEYIKNFGPAGAMSASAEAMAPFMIAHMNGGRFGEVQLLQSDTVDLMHSKLFTHDDRVAAMAHGFYEIHRNGQRFIGHGGDTIAFHSQLVLEPESNFGFYLSFNTPEGAQARGGIVNGVIDYFFPSGEPMPGTGEKPPLIDGHEARIAAVAGSYRFNRRSYTTIEGVTGLGGDLPVVPAGPGTISIPIPQLGGQFVEVEPYVFRLIDGDERLVFVTDDSGQVSHGLISSLPIMVADRVGFFGQASNHQLIIGLALLASLFVIINAIRNRKETLSGAAAWGRRLVVSTAVLVIVFVAGTGAVVGAADMNKVLFDFPPAGLGFVLLFPVLGVIATIASVGMLPGVWRSADCSTWARVRYTYVVLVFVLFFLVLNYWNMLGWNY